MDISNLSLESICDLLRALNEAYPSVFTFDPEALRNALQAASAPQAPQAAPLPDSPESPDASPAHPFSPDAAMETDPDLRPITSDSDSTDDTPFSVVDRKRKKKRSPKSDSAPPAKTTVPPATDRPVSPLSPPSAPSDAAKKEKLPPPIYLREKAKWDNVSKLLVLKKIEFTKAQNTKDGIKVQVQTSNDHRRLTSILRQESIGFHTYALEDERLLRVVIRGLPAEHSTDSIKADLVAQNFPVREVHRMYSGKTKVPYELVLVVLDLSPEGKAIFNLKTVNRLSGLRIEAPHRNGSPSQCHRCQLYGHSAKNCYARPRCVKCLGDHGTADCTRTRDTPEPPSCVLCRAQGHTANYRGCPMAPKANKKVIRRAPDRVPPPRQYSNVTSKVALVPQGKPMPSTSAWAKPLPYTSRAPQAKAPLPPSAPAPAPAVASRSKMVSHSDLVPELASPESKFIDFTKAKMVLCKLKQAKSGLERMMILADHMDIVNYVENFDF